MCRLRTTPRLFETTRPSRDLTVGVSARRDRRPRGMTLIEILLVLILLVVIGSFAMPLVEGGFASIRLRRGTDQVLAAWTEIRAKSIESGQVYQFRFADGSGAYRVDPWYIDENFQITESSSRKALSSKSRKTSASNEGEEPGEPNWSYEASLAEQIIFEGGERASSDGQGTRQVEKLQDEADGEWSAPILFFPDGTTSEASVLLRNAHGRGQRATLRALTGVARASALLSEEGFQETDSHESQ